MRGVGDAPHQHPGALALDVKKARRLLEPGLGLAAQLLEAPGRGLGVAPEEPQASLAGWQSRLAEVDPQHGAHPEILADALMHHVLVRRPRAGLGPKGEVAVGEQRPDGKGLEALRLIGLEQEVVPSHERAPFTARGAAYHPEPSGPVCRFAICLANNHPFMLYRHRPTGGGRMRKMKPVGSAVGPSVVRLAAWVILLL